MPNQFNSQYFKKKVLVTGNTGFKGSWLSIWLKELGADVYGFSNEVPTTPSHFEVANLTDHLTHHTGDVRDLDALKTFISDVQPDFIFHLAAQPLVRLSYQQPALTLETNFMGTVNVLEAARAVQHKCNVILITSDKCYDNVEWEWGYRESDPVGGKDPYSASKGAAELAIKTYAHSFFMDPDSPVKVAVGRAGNVIGGGDWALDRIIPDCMRSWSKGEAVDVRSPQATRPWQHVLEPLSGYLQLGAELAQRKELNGEPYNFGPPANQNKSVEALIDEMMKYWEKIQWNDVSNNAGHVHEAGLLKLCCDKALHQLNWEPTLNFSQTVRMTVEWYRNFYSSPDSDIFAYSRQQIQEYTTIAKERGMEWSK